MSDPIQILEAAYSPSVDEAAWLGGIAEAARAELDDGHGVIAVTYDASADDWVGIRQMVAPGVDESLLASLFNVPDFSGPNDLPKVFRGTVSRSIFEGTPYPAIDGYFRAVAEGREKLGDLRFINATDPTHLGCMLVVASGQRKRWSPRVTHRWSLVAAHVAAGLRVRRRLSEPPASATSAAPEAILTPDGRVEHAEAPAQGELARAALKRSTRALDRARGPLRRADPEEALAIWQGLVEGRWSLIDHVDSDGRRFVLARRNDPDTPDLRGLTLRERQVVSYVALGHANKVIAYELGLTPSTVAEHLARARRKLGLRSLSALRDAVESAGVAEASDN